MAYNNLKAEADEILDICWGKNGKANKLRIMANQITHIFRMSEKRTTEAIMKERNKRSKKGPAVPKNASAEDKFNVKWGEHKFKGKDAIIKKFSGELIEEIRIVLNKTAGCNLLPGDNIDGIKFGITTTTPYDTLETVKRAASRKVIDGNKEYENLFGQTNVVDIGHTESIASMKAGVTGNFWEGSTNNMLAGDTWIDTKFQNEMREVGLKAYDAEIKKLLPKINIGHHTEANIKQGKLKSVTEIEADIDSNFHNQVIQANTSLEAPYSEREIGKHTKAAHKEAQAAVKKYYKKKGVKGAVLKKASTPFIDSMKAMFLGSSVRKIAKKATLSKIKVKEPKSIRPRKAPATKKIKPLEMRANIHTTPISALGGLPKSKPQQRKKETSESTDSVASLYALLNAKLPRTVAENMGLPGLENQSGRFASSVRVTDVSQTAQGFPSIGYTYQKNPYQVFEMGAGTAPWATPARDPRTLIDASIREVAMQLAVGRFYTRRV